MWGGEDDSGVFAHSCSPHGLKERCIFLAEVWSLSTLGARGETLGQGGASSEYKGDPREWEGCVRPGEQCSQPSVRLLSPPLG